jgi:acylphosphatase
LSVATPKPGRRPAPLANGEPKARLEAIVRGRVQGVGFRYFVLREATRLGLSGWVANLSDGGLQCVAEGPKPALELLAASLTAGPPGSHVADVSLHWGPPVDAPHRFEIRSGAHRGD